MERADFIYCIGNLEKAVCKIGYSQDPNKKLEQIQTGTYIKLSILGIKSGGYSEERKLHYKFTADNLEGEWYVLTEDIKSEFNIKGQKGFFYIFEEVLELELSAGLFHLIITIMSEVEYNSNKIILDAQTRNRFASKISNNPQTVNNNITKLVKMGLLIKISRAVYRVNSKYYWKGDLSKR